MIMRTTAAQYSQDFVRACKLEVVKTLRDYGCEVYDRSCRPSWAVATNFSMRVETPMRDLGYVHEPYRVFEAIKIAASKAGQELQGLPVYDISICVRDDPSACYSGKRIIIHVVHDPMPNAVNLDEQAPNPTAPTSYNLQSSRLIRD